MKAVVISARPGVNELLRQEPTIEARGRQIEFGWHVGPGHDHFDRECDVWAVLSIYSHHPERKWYTATLRREERADGMRSCMIRMGRDEAFTYREASPRYSQKDLIAFSQRALDQLKDRGHDPEVLDIFGIEPITTVGLVEQAPSQPTLDWLQSLVDGSIEPIYGDEQLESYVNEEGKCQDGGLYPNPVATAWWLAKLEAAEMQCIPGDYVAGSLVIVGPLDDDGNTTGVTDEVVAEVQAFVAGKVAATV